MIRNFKLSFMAAALIMAACQREHVDIAEISVSDTWLPVTKLGVTEHNSKPHTKVTSGTYWRAFIAGEYDWIEMSPMGSAAGSVDVHFTVRPNFDGECRQAEIRLETADGAFADITVVQYGGDSDVAIIADDYGEGSHDEVDVRYAGASWYGVGTESFNYDGEDAFVSGASSSSGYDGASGGANVVVRPGGKIVFSNISTSFASQFRLSWGQWGIDDSEDFNLFCSSDAMSWEPVPYTLAGSADWKLARTRLIFGDDGGMRHFMFVNNSSEDKRIDDFRMVDAVFSDEDYTVVSAALPNTDLNWNSGEKIIVFSGKEPVCFDWCGYGNDFRSIFGLRTSDRYTAMYPYGCNASLSGGVLSFDVSGKQQYMPGYNVNMPMLAESPDLEFRFSQLMGILRVNAKGDVQLNSLAFTNDTQAVCGHASVTDGVLSLEEDGGRTVVLENLAGVDASSFDIVLPEGRYDRYVLKAVDQSGESMEYVMENLDIRKGMISEVEIDFSPSNSISLNMPSYYGETGENRVFANCWRISAPGDYMFISADASGNIVKGSDASWVWATSGVWGGISEAHLSSLISDIRYEDDCVKFTVPEDFVPGNVILAVIDADGQICCSWHVWTTVCPEDINAGGYVWMDRNLGASYAFDPVGGAEYCNAARGFYYQWGSKNPVVGMYDSTAANGDAFTMGKGATWYIYNKEVRNTCDWGVLSSYPLSWSSSYTDYMQYPMNMFPDNTKNPAYGKTGSWPEETNPCPHGYCVPSRVQMSSLGAATIVNDSDAALKNVAVVRSGVVFPSCGYRKDSGTLAISGNPDMRYWTDAAYNAASRYYWLANKSNNKEMYAGLEVGMNIRCVKIKK